MKLENMTCHRHVAPAASPIFARDGAGPASADIALRKRFGS